MTDRKSLAERVAEYRDRHPGAGVPAIAGALNESPADVKAVLDDNSEASEPDESCEDLNTDVDDCPTLEAEPNVWASNVEDYDCWIPWGRVDGRKQPHAVYASHDNPMSWSEPDLWRDAESARMAIVDDRIEGPGIVLQHEDDPYADWADPFYVVDYDDVRDPKTGAVHPTVAEHVEMADSYADVSTSGTGVHIIAQGSLPEDVKTIQATLPDHDAFPGAEIEVYDGKRFVAMTGDHVVGTPTEATDAQAFLDDLVDEFVSEEERRPQTPRPDAEDWDPEYDADELADLETTTDIQAVFDACQLVEPRDIRLRSSLTEERGDGTMSFDPSWETSRSGTRLGWSPEVGWIYRKGDVGLDAIQVVALEERLISSVHQYPEGRDWWRAVEALRDRGARIPEFEHPESDGRSDDQDRHPLLEAALDAGDEIDADPTSALPLAQLDAIAPHERRRAARKRGLEWPDTDEARDALQEAINEVLRNEDDRVVDAPTALGKTHTVATARWGAREDLTGDRPVVHLLETTDARDEAIEKAEEHGGSYHVLRGRHEACAVAAGDHDPREVAECDDEDRQELTVDGEPASQWLDRQCNAGGKGMAFSAAHRWLADHNDQGVELPCGGDSCHAIQQWETYREGPEGRDYWPLVIATHNFAHAPGLRMQNNLVVDEEPDYEVDLSTDRVRSAVGAYLQEIDAPVATWEAFVQLSKYDGFGDDAGRERDALEDALNQEPAREWYFEEPDAHVLAPALARAIFHADARANGRRAGKTVFEPPRLEAGARDDDEWNREWVSVVLDESNDVQTVRTVPDFNAARSVVGLDAHPAEPIWQANTLPWMGTTEVLDIEARRLWRRYERGLRVVQVGDATRPLSGDSALDWLDDNRLAVLLEHLVDEYGADFRTAITTAQVEGRLEELMDEAGIATPELMHFGEEKSRNDFATEPVGLVNGCMDPGDDFIVDLLAELDLQAEAETAVDDDGNEYRAKGRGFEGADAETAQEILASVRENHIAQAAGRYARDPEDPATTATVFVRTDASPPGFADVEVPGVEWTFTDLQEAIVEDLRDHDGARTAREIADDVGCSKEHVRQTLDRLRDIEGPDPVQAVPGEGEQGATLYADTGLPHSGVVDVDESPTDAYGTTSRWSLAIRDPDRVDPPNEVTDTSADSNASDESAAWEWWSADEPG